MHTPHWLCALLPQVRIFPINVIRFPSPKFTTTTTTRPPRALQRPRNASVLLSHSPFFDFRHLKVEKGSILGVTAVGRALSRSRRIGASPAVLDMFIARSVDVTPPRMRFVITSDLVESRKIWQKLRIWQNFTFHDVADA